MLHNMENFITLQLSEKAETGNAGEQPVRNILIDENIIEVGANQTSNLNFIFVFYSLKNSHYFFIPVVHFPLRQYKLFIANNIPNNNFYITKDKLQNTKVVFAIIQASNQVFLKQLICE